MTDSSKVIAAVDGDWIAEQTQRLVEIPSVTLHEEEVCLYFEELMREIGLEVDVREVTRGRSNLYARIRGSGGGPNLMFNGHLDTISNQNDQPDYREGDLLFGRGTTDMKGGMAAMLGAARALSDSGVVLKGDLLLTAVVGHEEPEAKKDGPRALIDDVNSGRISCDRIIIVEGADELWVMSMGSMVFTIELEGTRGGTHTQYVPFSENPIHFLGKAIGCISEFQSELDNGQVHPLAGPERIDIGMVRAGDYFNRTPGVVTLTGTRRWSPGRKAGEIREELQRKIQPIAEEGRLTVRVSMEQEREPFETPSDDAIVEAIAKAHREVTSKSPRIIGRRIVGDANLYVHGCGVPTVYYGPSNDTAHADVENVSISLLESVAKVYALAAMEYCGVSG